MLKKYGSCKSLGLVLLRIAVGVPFLVHGIMKLQNMEGTTAFFNTLGFGSFFAWLVALTETIGGALIILGITKGITALLAIIMLVAIFKVKWARGYMAFELDFVLLFATLALACIGPGRCALLRGKLGATGCECEGGDCKGCGDKKEKKNGCCGGGCC